jgi:hypothetical protein
MPDHRAITSRAFACIVVAAFVCAGMPSLAAESSAGVATTNKAFYVLVDPGGDKAAASIIAISVAAELNKTFAPPAGGADKPWAIPEASWSAEALAKQCREDPNALGGVIVAYYTGNATHFWLLWQSDTTTIAVFAQLVSCNRNGTGGASPSTVAIVSELHGSNGALWVERRSQASIPLLSFAAIVALLAHGVTTSKPNTAVSSNVALAASIGAAVVGQSLNKDIPGYSEPLRLRYGAQHVGDDLAGEMRWFCGTGAGAKVPTGALAELCSQTGLTPAAGT